MSWLTQNLTPLFQFIPGFISAAIYFTLTAHPKASEFERVVQALVFSVLLKCFLMPTKWLFLWLGKRSGYSLRPWDADVELVWMIVYSLPLGLAAAYLSNSDRFHAWARRRGWSTRTSFPSEWYGAFTREEKNLWVILHLQGERRLRGWAEEWPDQADKGHFFIDQPEWVLADGKRVPIFQTRKLLVRASEVERVEFIAGEDQQALDPAEVSEIQKPLLELHRGSDDGGEATESSSSTTIR